MYSPVLPYLELYAVLGMTLDDESVTFHKAH